MDDFDFWCENVVDMLESPVRGSIVRNDGECIFAPVFFEKRAN